METMGKNKFADKVLFVLALMVLAAALIRFGVNRSEASKAPIPNIVFSQWWEKYHEKQVLLDLIKEFEDTHENIKITLNHLSYEDMYRELFGAGDSSGLPGDLITLDTLWIPELIKNESMELKWFSNGQLSDFEAPLISFDNVFYYNVEILREAGFSQPPKNRNEFLNHARAISSVAEESGGENGPWALSMGRNCSRGIYDNVFPWIWAAGAELVRDGKPAINTRSVIESLTFLATLEQDNFIAPGAAFADSGKKLEDFISGRAAFMIAPSIDIEFITERMGEDAFSVTSIPIPANYAGKTWHASSEWTLGINPESAYREEARLFAEFLSKKAPILSEKLTRGNNAQNPIYLKVDDIAIASESSQDFSGLPWGQLEGIFSEEFSILLAGHATPAATAATIQKRWEEAISAFD